MDVDLVAYKLFNVKYSYLYQDLFKERVISSIKMSILSGSTNKIRNIVVDFLIACLAVRDEHLQQQISQL